MNKRHISKIIVSGLVASRVLLTVAPASALPGEVQNPSKDEVSAVAAEFGDVAADKTVETPVSSTDIEVEHDTDVDVDSVTSQVEVPQVEVPEVLVPTIVPDPDDVITTDTTAPVWDAVETVDDVANSVNPEVDVQVNPPLDPLAPVDGCAYDVSPESGAVIQCTILWPPDVTGDEPVSIVVTVDPSDEANQDGQSGQSTDGTSGNTTADDGSNPTAGGPRGSSTGNADEAGASAASGNGPDSGTPTASDAAEVLASAAKGGKMPITGVGLALLALLAFAMFVTGAPMALASSTRRTGRHAVPSSWGLS